MTTISKSAPMVAILALGSALLFAGDAVARGPEGGAAFSKIDANGDGQITAEEFQAFKEARIANIDTNGDGFLSEDELAAAAKARHEQRQQHRQDRRFEMLMSKADTNGDGKLSTEEFQTFMQSRGRGKMMGQNGFPPGWDANGDGVVTQEEFQTALAKMMQKRGDMRGRHGDGEGGHGTW